jgi:hypothetical protein
MKMVKEALNDHYDNNYDLYKILVSEHPPMKLILETILKTSPENRIEQIREEKDRIVFWFSNFGSMAIYFGNKQFMDLMRLYDVYIQVPGNQTYSFSVSINKEQV